MKSENVHAARRIYVDAASKLLDGTPYIIVRRLGSLDEAFKALKEQSIRAMEIWEEQPEENKEKT